MGAKKTFKWYLKSAQTHRQTDRQTHIWTNRLIESIDPEGPCFENKLRSYYLRRFALNWAGGGGGGGGNFFFFVGGDKKKKKKKKKN